MFHKDRLNKKRTDTLFLNFIKNSLKRTDKPQELLVSIEQLWSIHKELSKPTLPLAAYYKKNIALTSVLSNVAGGLMANKQQDSEEYKLLRRLMNELKRKHVSERYAIAFDSSEGLEINYIHETINNEEKFIRTYGSIKALICINERKS